MRESICIYVIICPKTIISVAHPPFLSYMTAFFKTNFGNFYNKIITYMYYVLKHKTPALHCHSLPWFLTNFKDINSLNLT